MHENSTRRVATSLSCVAATISLALPTSDAAQANRTVALTFDDLPVVAAGPEPNAPEIVTAAVLQKLGRAGVPAVGFVNEGKIDSAGVASRRGTAIPRATFLGEPTVPDWVVELSRR